MWLKTRDLLKCRPIIIISITTTIWWPILFIDPILPGGIELIRKWDQEDIVTNKGYDAVFRASRNITFVLETT